MKSKLFLVVLLLAFLAGCGGGYPYGSRFYDSHFYDDCNYGSHFFNNCNYGFGHGSQCNMR